MQAPKPEERVELTLAIMHLLDRWGIAMADRIGLLALPSNNKPRNMRRYLEGEPLPDKAEVWERVGHLVGIAEALHTTYPLNQHMGILWMQQPNRRFDNRAPTTAMVEDGLAGILAVREHLDCAYAWHRDEVGQAA